MRYVKIILENILITWAYAFLTVPHKIINGGVTSFSMIAASFLHSDTALIANVITLLLLASRRIRAAERILRLFRLHLRISHPAPRPLSTSLNKGECGCVALLASG